MAKFKVGDKVRVRKFETRPDHWNNDGGMDHWMGEIVTLETIDKTRKNPDSSRYVTSSVDFSLQEDKKEFRGVKWVWKESDFELIKPRREFIVIRRDGNVMTAEHRVNREVIKSAKATCALSDTFDFDTGAKLAFDRLMGREEPKPAPQPAHRFKVGDRVVINETGKIGEVSAISTEIPFGCNILVAHENGFHSGYGFNVSIAKKEHDGKCEWFYPKNLSPAPAPEPPKYIPKVGDRVVTKFGNGTICSIDKFGSVAVWHDSWNLGHNISSAVKGLYGNKGQWFTPSTLNPVAGASDV